MNATVVERPTDDASSRSLAKLLEQGLEALGMAMPCEARQTVFDQIAQPVGLLLSLK